MVSIPGVYVLPWGLRHVLRWLFTFAAWLGNRCRPLPFANGIEAFTPGPITLAFVKRPSPDVVVHEYYHQARCRELGLLRYWWLMTSQYVRHGYADAPEERAARIFAGQED